MAHGPDTHKLMRLLSFVKTSNTKLLTISNLNITSLPELPSCITDIICNYTPLTSLPNNLPPNLESLSCAYTKITSLPPLPNHLRRLICSNTNLTSLPPLPRGLNLLCCNNIIIRKLPQLPPYLTTLICDHTYIRELPSLPHGLQVLNCSSNHIQILPPLPSSLRILNCEHCPLFIKQKRFESIETYTKRWSALTEELIKQRCQERCLTVKEELMAAAWHPRRVERWIEACGIEVLDCM
jgi:Leucine-rich repeat (LRR) protein